MKKRRDAEGAELPMFDNRPSFGRDVFEEVERAIRKIIAAREPQFRRRKRSRHLWGFWIMEGARAALEKPLRPSAPSAPLR